MTENLTSKAVLSFDEYYDNLPDGTKKTILLQYMSESEKSIGTFYNKKKRKEFTKLEKSFFEKICGESFLWDK